MVTQLINPLMTAVSSISNTTGTAVAKIVHSLVTVLSGVVNNLICALDSPLPKVSTTAQKALVLIQTPLQGLTDAVTGVLNDTDSSLSPNALASLHSELTVLNQLGSSIVGALAGVGK
jgi:hypothetical protein